jgi:hypothetical protein
VNNDQNKLLNELQVIYAVVGVILALIEVLTIVMAAAYIAQVSIS